MLGVVNDAHLLLSVLCGGVGLVVSGGSQHWHVMLTMTSTFTAAVVVPAGKFIRQAANAELPCTYATLSV